MKTRRFDPTIFIDVFIIAGILALGGCWILPQGNHPFNDDWSYATIAKTLFETGRLEFINWGEPTLLSHLVWGGLFAALFGFSFTSLQLSVLSLSIAGGIVFYLILKLLSIPRFFSLAGALLLVVNPIYFINSFSYMTDSVFVSEMLIALYFYLLFIKKKGNRFLILSGLFSVVAFSNRQFALVLPVALGVHVLFSSLNKKSKRVSLLWVSLLPALADILILFWHRSLPYVPLRSLEIQPQKFYWRCAFLMTLYTGFFSMPVVLPWIFSSENRKKLNAAVNPLLKFGTLFALAVVLCFFPVKTMPLLTNNITRFGMFMNDEVLPGVRQELFPKTFWIVVTGLTLISTALIVLMVLCDLRNTIKYNQPENPMSMLKILFSKPTSVVYLTSFFLFLCPFVIGSTFDRYTIMFLPGVVLYVLKHYSRFHEEKVGILTSLLLFSLFTCILVFDTIGWNRVRWCEAERLVQKGVSPRQIDAGVEWCGWYAKKPFPIGYRREPKPYFVSWYLRYCFNSADNRYAVSFSELNGFSVERKVRYRTVFWKKDPFLYVLKRNAAE